ncbi:hypothetical protein [Pseudoalteromonas sp. Of7M-16]|nr:hypothetical protein [Pseudoalteromonas sp. Of7M-16]MCG7550574.1 hypothetical protein [Pseudoalteromonas sp. Of7M-16]
MVQRGNDGERSEYVSVISFTWIPEPVRDDGMVQQGSDSERSEYTF